MKRKSISESGLFRVRLLSALLLCAMSVLLGMLTFAGAATRARSQSVVAGPFVAISPRAVSFDGDLRTLPRPLRPLRERPRREHLRHPENTPEPPYAGFVDRALQPLLPAAPMPTPSTSFKGLDYNTWGDGHPPDTVGDVGPNHFIQAVNTSVGIFNKSGALQAAFTFNSFFGVNGGTGTLCDTDNYGDPTILYDSLADRWIVSDFAFQTDASGNPIAPYYQCFAVSKSGNPITGGWWLYAMRSPDDTLGDYPKQAVWPDGIYMSANMFDNSGSFTNARVWVFNRDDFESGAPVRQISFDLPSNYWALLPSNFRGTPPPAGRPNYFVSYQENNQFAGSTIYVHRFKVTSWSPPAATFTGPTNVVVAQYREAPYLAAYVPELAGETLDTLGDRLMMQNQYRNINGVESLWNMHTVIVPTAGPQTGIRWYQFNVTGDTIATTPIQQSTYAPDTNYRWMGSLAVDKDGNMAMGYSVSSPAMFPAVRYVGRLASDAPNTIGQTEASLVEGAGSQAGGVTRWGDYSAMSVDPADDCTFWYTQMYYDTPGPDWQTRIGSFRFPTCTNAPVSLGSVVSRKTHGVAAFDVDLPLSGKPGIECRSDGASGDHTLVFTFAAPLRSVGGASVTSGVGSVSGAAVGADNHQYIVNLTGVTNAQTITVALLNVSDTAGHSSASIPVSMSVLAGDTTGDGVVNSADIAQTKSQSGSGLTSANFREDVTVDGNINSADIALVKSKSGTGLP